MPKSEFQKICRLGFSWDSGSKISIAETVVERRGDEDIYYLGSIQGDKLLAKYGCVPSHNRHLNNNSK